MTNSIQPFPYETLPQFTHDELALQKRVLKQYTFLEGSRDIFGELLAPMNAFLPKGFHVDLLQVSSLHFSDFQNRFARDGLFCLVKVLPQNRFAFIAFDPVFAKFIVTQALSGGSATPEHILTDQVRPLTAIEEGVVEYLVVSCLHEIELKFQKKDFSLLFETVLTHSPKLTGYFSAQDEFSLFSFVLHAENRDFCFEFALPLTLGKDLGWDRAGEVFAEQRIQDFQRFKMDFQVEIGQVELTATDFQDMREGDIILLDNCELDALSPLQGSARLKHEHAVSDIGYELKLRPNGENLIAEIIGIL